MEKCRSSAPAAQSECPRTRVAELHSTCVPDHPYNSGSGSPEGASAPGGGAAPNARSRRGRTSRLGSPGISIVPYRPIGDGERGLGPARSGAPSSLGWMARPPSTVVRLGSRRVVRRRAAVLFKFQGWWASNPRVQLPSVRPPVYLVPSTTGRPVAVLDSASHSWQRSGALLRTSVAQFGRIREMRARIARLPAGRSPV